MRTGIDDLDLQQDSPRWAQVFGDEALATAILDRLLHHAEIVSINGPSSRLKDRTLTPGGDTNH